MRRKGPGGPRDRVVLVHSSDELYGSDRMVLQVVDSMPTEIRARLIVLLPHLAEGPGGLTAALRSAGVDVAHQDLPVLRRREISRPWALLTLVRRTVALATWLRRQRAGLVYCATSATAPAVVAARAAGVSRSVVHVQEVWGPAERMLLGPLVGNAGQVVTISQAVHDALPERVRRRAVVVENGIATPSRDVVARPADGPRRFLVASRWNSWKGHRTLLEAWDSFDEPPGRLLIAGAPPELGDAVDVAALVSGLSHPESVEIVGQVDSIFDLLDEVDVLVVPSDKPEPFGLVAIEAFSRGRAVIGSDAGGLADIVDHGVNGVKFPPGRGEALRTAIDQLGRPVARRMGDMGRKKFEEKYSGAAFAERMQRVWSPESERAHGDGVRR